MGPQYFPSSIDQNPNLFGGSWITKIDLIRFRKTKVATDTLVVAGGDDRDGHVATRGKLVDQTLQQRSRCIVGPVHIVDE